MDEAAETVAWDEPLVVQLEARRRRGVVGLEPLLDGAALVRMAVGLLAFGIHREGVKRWSCGPGQRTAYSCRVRL